MKKKGLIIATIVMVLVLAVSLTTATYAWFNAASTTKIDAFTFSVANNNDVNIGLKADNIYDDEATSASYVSGTVTYAPGTAGVTEGITTRSAWTGTVNGLSNTIDHDINWGAQAKAVGFSTKSDKATVTAAADMHAFGTATTSNSYVYSASGVAQTSITNVQEAVCIGSLANETKADYVYLPLGVQPNKALQKCELIIYVDASTSAASICGMLSALHIAYRINGSSTVVDSQPFSGTYDSSLASASAGLSSTVPSGAPSGFTATEQSALNSTFGVTYQATKSGAVKIDLSTQAAATSDIAQVDMWFYLAGNDTDCNQGAVVNVTGNMYIYFYTIPAVTP